MMRFLRKENGQVFPFMIIIVVIIILAIVATMLLGEVGFNRIRLSNVIDSAVLSPTSGFCRSLNQIVKISFGDGGLLQKYIALQVFFLKPFKPAICPCDGIPYPFTWQFIWSPFIMPFYIQTLIEIFQLYESAEDIAEKAPEDLRKGILDRAMGGALIDEAKPFRSSEVTRDSNGKITALDYNAYLDRDSHFDEVYRTQKSSLWSGDRATYAWNKKYWKNKSAGTFYKPGVLETSCGSCSDSDYGSYLDVNFVNVPRNVSISAQFMPLFYLWQKVIPGYPKCYCIVLPGFAFDPYAWISNINIDSKSYGLNVRKKLDYQDLTFFGRQPIITHKNQVRIHGSVQTGYDFGLES
ncbi:MAG: hypothetical protein WDL87_07945 [Candidatus Omnitrophota bacterium]|jgi:hypothetical protein